MKHVYKSPIKSGLPFRRKGWADDDVFVFVERPEDDIVAVMETDPLSSVGFDIQDILADDWYTRPDRRVAW